MSRAIALYGGSFDPPHSGHVAAARAVLDALTPDELLWMPAAQAPHKSPAAVSAAHRLAMSRLAVEHLPRAAVSDYEMTPGVSGYTVDTVRHLREQSPGARLWLVVGADMLEHLPRWYQIDTLLAHCAVAALARRVQQCVEQAAERLRRDFRAEVRVIAHEPVEISSTELRAMLAQGEGRDYLPEAVWAYISEHKLYTAKYL